MNQAQFLQALGERSAEREEIRARVALVMRAMRVQQIRRRVSNVCELIVPAFAWIGAFVTLVWSWRGLTVHTFAAIVVAHVLFRAFMRVFINVVWIPSMVRDLARRFPEFKTEIEDSFEKYRADDDD